MTAIDKDTALDELGSDEGSLIIPQRSAESAANASRYGRTPARKRRSRRLYGIATIAILILGVAWLIWAALDQSGSTLDATDTGSTIVNDHSVSVSYQISMKAGQKATCALQVQNSAHSIVGWKIVPVPASSSYTRSYTTVVQSSELAVTGLIYQCWLS